MTDMHFMYIRANENSRETHRLYAELLFITQNRTPQIIHQISLATGRIWVLRCTGTWSQNQCAKNCSCWGYWCSPCLENFSWIFTLPISNQRMQALIPLHHRARVAFCQWILEKFVVNTQFVDNVLFTGIRDSQGTVWWSSWDDSPHTIVASSHHHRLSFNVWVGILSDHFIGPVVLPNRLTDWVYIVFWWMIYQHFWKICLFINGNACGSCMMGHHLIYSALSESTWTRLSVNSG
jgi:hypothetical protein